MKTMSSWRARELWKLPIHLMFLIITVLMILPLVMIFSISISEEAQILGVGNGTGFSILPKGLSLDGYRLAFKNPESVIRAYGVTAYSSFVGTFISMTSAGMIAYPLARSNFKYKPIVQRYLLITMLFGADEGLLAMAQKYMRPIKCVFPLFLFNQMLAAFLRNDNNPGLATLGVLSGGIFNVLGDYFFVFTRDMGIYGAGLAAVIGSAISFIVMLTHFADRKNTLRLVKPEKLPGKLREISVTGFSTYYFQAIMKPGAAFIVSVARGLIVSGALIMILPMLAGASALWFAMPVTELLVALYAAWVMRRETAALGSVRA